ncbi:ATP-binding protein [Lacticaseibacillus manihotivorans]|uniref:ATP-binding protein n=1 Tax=Lacticaseibacillus manihotivorans TaxID=88233 RepID=UPI001FB2BB28|nr:ATP-binding protein [Lacticaseibacillus manihotivorans]
MSPKDSLFRIVARNTAITPVISMVDEVDTNRVMTFIDETPTSLLQYLDDSIDYLRYQHDEKTGKVIDVRLKFKGQSDPYIVQSFQEIKQYLSSGTVRGITLLFQMLNAMRKGATLLMDEAELHINKRIVEDFIAFFSKFTNQHFRRYIGLFHALYRADR